MGRAHVAKPAVQFRAKVGARAGYDHDEDNGKVIGIFEILALFHGRKLCSAAVVFSKPKQQYIPRLT